MDVFILVILIILGVLLFVANIYIYSYFAHPDDKSPCSGVFSKIVVFVAMTLCWGQLLCLPLDVANNRGGGLGFRMDVFWPVIYCIIAVFILIIIPFTSSYNECDEDSSFGEKFKSSLCSLIVITCVFIGCTIISFFVLSKADIPITKRHCPITAKSFTKSSHNEIHVEACQTEESIITIDVSYPVFLVGIISFASWFLLSVFGSIGLVALPLDFLYEFSNRPKTITRDEVEQKKKELTNKTKDMKMIATKVKNMEEQGYNKKAGKHNSQYLI